MGHAAILPSPPGEVTGTIEVRQATGSYYTGEGGEEEDKRDGEDESVHGDSLAVSVPRGKCGVQTQ